MGGSQSKINKTPKKVKETKEDNMIESISDYNVNKNINIQKNSIKTVEKNFPSLYYKKNENKKKVIEDRPRNSLMGIASFTSFGSGIKEKKDVKNVYRCRKQHDNENNANLSVFFTQFFNNKIKNTINSTNSALKGSNIYNKSHSNIISNISNTSNNNNINNFSFEKSYDQENNIFQILETYNKQANDTNKKSSSKLNDRNFHSNVGIGSYNNEDSKLVLLSTLNTFHSYTDNNNLLAKENKENKQQNKYFINKDSKGHKENKEQTFMNFSASENETTIDRSTILTTQTSSKFTNSIIFNSNHSNLSNNPSNSNFNLNLSKSSSKSNFKDEKIISNPIRDSYFTKLVTKNVLPTTTSNSIIQSNKIFIFDWDDTLFCTSYLYPNGVFKEGFRISERDNKYIKELEQLVIDILKYSISNGDTYIITNAAYRWVEYSSKQFYRTKEFNEILKQVKIISARNEFEKDYPRENKEWKNKTFSRLTDCYDSKLLTNLLCFGDSNLEIDACQLLNTKFENALIKSIKFREKPKPEELIKELKLVKSQLEMIYSVIRPLTVNVEKKRKS